MTIAPFLLALDVATSLTASGVDATTRVTPDGRVELLVLLEPWTRTMAVLDVCDLSEALIDGQDAEPHTVPGPSMSTDVEVCDEVACVSTAVWVWVLRWRGSVW